MYSVNQQVKSTEKLQSEELHRDDGFSQSQQSSVSQSRCKLPHQRAVVLTTQPYHINMSVSEVTEVDIENPSFLTKTVV